MPSAVDILAERVAGAVDLIESLRKRVKSLEWELSVADAKAHAAAAEPVANSPDPSLLAELERLRAERVVVRESIRGLLREIDRVSW